MPSVVLIHGTGVRQPAYDSLFDRVGAELRDRGTKRNLVACYWGGSLGARLARDGRSIPGYDTTRDVSGAADPSDEAAARWEILTKDPLFELRLLAQAPDSGPRKIGEEAPGDDLFRTLTEFRPSPELTAALERSGLAPDFEKARRKVAQAEPVRAALRVAPSELDAHRRALARAIVATASELAEARSGGEDGTSSWVLAGPRRDELVDLIFTDLGGGERSVFGWIGRQFAGVAAWTGTTLVKRKRGALTDAGSPAAGDVLLYQTRGEPIRNFIRDTIAAASPPVTVIAHSLGGIATVDLLAMENVPAVELLVTVGSQSPFLFELGALFSLPLTPTVTLPAHFPRWVNVYDRRDFLSYVAKPVFEDDRITDVEVDNRESFPRSHSAYWSNPALWEAIDRAWASL